MKSSVRLLIVEDEAQLVKVISGFLQSFPGEFEILSADSGEEALKLLESSAVDILLTDVRLPGMDGTEVVRRALELRPGLKVVVMTAFSSQALRSRVLRDGALHFVEKPFDLPELRKLLREAAGSEGGWTGSMHGLDLFDLTQLLILVRKTRAVLVQAGQHEGRLAFVAGEIHHASTGDLIGPDAYFEMVNWDGGSFGDLPDIDATEMVRNVTLPAGHLMIEAARRRDEFRRSLHTAEAPSAAESIADPEPVSPPAAAPAAQLSDQTEELLKTFVGTSPFIRFASLYDLGGDIISATTQPPEQLDELTDWFLSLEGTINDGAMGRVVVEDQAGTLVLSQRYGEHRLLVVAQANVPLAVVTQSVEGLEKSVWQTPGA